jgi:hypothetical protein
MELLQWILGPQVFVDGLPFLLHQDPCVRLPIVGALILSAKGKPRPARAFSDRTPDHRFFEIRGRKAIGALGRIGWYHASQNKASGD